MGRDNDQEEIWEPDEEYAKLYALLEERIAAFQVGEVYYCLSDQDMILEGSQVQKIEYPTLLHLQEEAHAHRQPGEDEEESILTCAFCEEGLVDHFQQGLRSFAKNWDFGDMEMLQYYRERGFIPNRWENK